MTHENSEAFEVVGADRPARFFFTCDHAANTIPAAYNDLGLGAEDLGRHIAYDVGARGVTLRLAEALNGPAVCAKFSRLLIDPNRGEDDPTLIMRLYDRSIIPGNAGVDATERERRLARFHRPYHDAISDLLDRASVNGASPLLVSTHSFTPQLRGRAPRPWRLGVLWGRDEPTARRLLELLRRAHPDLMIGENEPYTGYLENDAMWRHGGDRGLAHVLIEIRNDLIADAEGQARWASALTEPLRALEAERRGA